ncbi:50S ribosomal protein L35ae [Candidatus Woesearchaeota archaeon]|nr:50S ribosomal protein L35ae [Candidatus Woesearchaeota archaeon]
MKGTISNYRRGRRTQKTNQAVIIVEKVKNREDAEKLVGKKVEWIAPGKNKTKISGKISSAHGNKGAVRALFETGIPGQALGKQVDII